MREGQPAALPRDPLQVADGVRSDGEAKLVQTLTRHSTIQLLFDRYGHAKKKRGVDAVNLAITNPVRTPRTESG